MLRKKMTTGEDNDEDDDGDDEDGAGKRKGKKKGQKGFFFLFQTSLSYLL